ncbi:hypothetical protein JAAARDRAFT_201700 [Jaapia argillacea MUCL 33604]|uniref:Aminoglycoside phosphotransferase domain-containing protein n=1 Tax=Jaapia argillacea MUCL 33604 TaxID=933084 RepID=A0A067QBA5_9AGAM|nr:hypothetical protein JAAARDRAFT_201700 [Jaapia argillacea MUCL 33604]
MILITFKPKTVPLGPASMLAHFPRGRPRLATQALVGMSNRLNETAFIRVPKIYDYIDYAPNQIGPEVVLMEKVAGEQLDVVWPTLNQNQAMNVVKEMTQLIVDLFNVRSPLICSVLAAPKTIPAPRSSRAKGKTRIDPPAQVQGPVLLMPAFEVKRDPQPALSDVASYLFAFVHHMRETHAHRQDGYISAEDAKILDTWDRLGTLIETHLGGSYLPEDRYNRRERNKFISTCREPLFPLLHRDMRMCRFVVETKPRTDDVVLTLTGWEHAHYAPVWSATRLPAWLDTGILNPLVSPDMQTYFGRQMLVLMTDQNSPIRRPSNIGDFLMCLDHCFAERTLETMLSVPSSQRDWVETMLVWMRDNWVQLKPNSYWPLRVGNEYSGRGLGQIV